MLTDIVLVSIIKALTGNLGLLPEGCTNLRQAVLTEKVTLKIDFLFGD